MKRSALAIVLVLATSCATENYRKATQAVGVIPVDVATNTYSVGVRANDTVLAEFIMRRCAEFTLEEGKRYFKVQSQYHGGTRIWTASEGFFGNKGAREKVTITLLDRQEPNSFDSVLIIKETNATALNVLSPRARATLATFSN